MNNKWPPGDQVVQQTGTIFELVQYIIGTNLLTKFHEDPKIIVPSTVLTRQIFMTHNGRQTIDKRENCPTPGGHVFPPIMTIFELVRDIYKIDENDPPSGGHAFLLIRTIFELNRHIQKTHVLTKFHEDWTKKIENCPAPWRPYINETNVLTKCHDDWAKIVTSRVFTRNTAPPPGGHVFQRTGTNWASNVTSTVFTSYELSRTINGINILTKFHEDQTINVASGVFTRQMLTTDDARRTTDIRRSQKLTMSTLCSARRRTSDGGRRRGNDNTSEFSPKTA
ncbi:hypothetical protein DPMN_127385 [Dreissena polymorpha]|uniref:Uncharacterized protein n=1 Tax=Dreissena polymorpha TaxID=45954 RepID=A0A9D4H158_DREPO|nr:hypothetical protein DPMN_127385 [Dreissena polymorpha]